MDRFACHLLSQQPWAIMPSALEALAAAVDSVTGSGRMSMVGGEAAKSGRSGGVGVIPIRGTLKQHAGESLFDFLFGGASTDAIAEQFAAYVADDAVRAIVFDIDSPGGSTYGMTELAGQIMAARGKKPIVAVANSVAASAAYWIAAAADQVYATPGALVGSIGVYMAHMDMAQVVENAGVKVSYVSAGKNKLRGNEFAPLSEDDAKHFQGIVDATYGQFVADVARGRGVTPAAVRGGFGEGDVVTAATAKKLGMVDGVMTLAAAIEKAGTLRSKAPAGTSAESPDIEPQANEEGRTRLRRLNWQAQQSLAETA